MEVAGRPSWGKCGDWSRPEAAWPQDSWAISLVESWDRLFTKTTLFLA